MNLNNYPLWTALITPLKNNGDVDYESLGKLVDEQESANNGILILGSTGEALNLDLYERQKILDFVISKSPSVPLMCGVGGSNLNEQVKWIEYLETLSLDAYLLVVPLYAKPGDEGQYHWFKTLMDSSTRPCMLYNVPSRTGISMSLKAVEKLNNHEKFWAIKEASGSVKDFKSYVAAAGAARVYSGDDALLPSFVPHGCKGLVSVASNSWPVETHKYVQKSLDGSLKDVDLWEESTNSLFIASNPIPVKWLMKHHGRIETEYLKAPLTHEDLVDPKELLNADKKIKQWFNQL